VAAGLAFAQTKKVLANDDVVQMVKAGFDEDTIINAIKANDTTLDVSVQALMDLKNAGVGKKVIDAMLDAEARKKPTASAPQASPDSASTSAASMSGRPKGENEARGGPAGPAIYVEEVSSSGGIVASSDTALEAIKTLQEKRIRVVTIREKADYVLQITRQLGKKSWKKDTKVVLSNREGEVVFTNSTRTIGGAMDGVAGYIHKKHE